MTELGFETDLIDHVMKLFFTPTPFNRKMNPAKARFFIQSYFTSYKN